MLDPVVRQALAREAWLTLRCICLWGGLALLAYIGLRLLRWWLADA